MVRMPVATLRVWERRYRISSPALTPSGQRLYTAADVRRIALIKQLTDLGHAIGSLATLDMAQLQSVATTHAGAVAGTLGSDAAATTGTAWRVAVVGAALARRLQRPTLRRRLKRPLEVLGPFDDFAQATAGIAGLAVDLLLVQAPTLQDGWLAQWRRAAPRSMRTAVLFRFASEAVCEQLAAAGLTLLREPPSDTLLGQWLQGLDIAEGLSPMPPMSPMPAHPALPPFEATPARRWDDSTLADIAGLSTTIACECPKHIAELLMQLSHFETYSAECAHRSAADAALHAYLGHVAGVSRARFEEALERVAVHEGLLFPRPAQDGPPTKTNPSRPEVGGAGG
jgi:DNA-binding transcriptional MerR regulator